jgi:thiol:disulfide interchange protein DsbA
MKRRDFVINASGLGLAAAATPLWAQQAAIEGRDYKRLSSAVPVPAGKVDVVEFFGYWCPHCFEFEPTLDAWVRKLNPAQVNFHRVAVSFRPSNEALQRLYYALESLGLVDGLHRKIFNAIHLEGKHLENDADVAAFLKATGVDATKVMDAAKSFSVATKIRQGKQLSEAFQIDGVPLVGVAGRWVTSPSIAGTPERTVTTMDALIAQARKG